MILRCYLDKIFNLCLKYDCFLVLLIVCIYLFIYEVNYKVKIVCLYKIVVYNIKYLLIWYICFVIFKREER